MKKFLLFPDKFKGSLSADEVINAMQEGIRSVFPNAEILSRIASDGGDGFQDAIARHRNVKEIPCQTVNAAGGPINAPFLYDAVNRTAYIELATASGLAQLPTQLRNPLKTSTYGTGLQIKTAMRLGAKTIYVGLGGSATNDGGIGIAQAIGYHFFNKAGELVKPIGAQLSAIVGYELPKDLKNITVYAVNDVNNPLCGNNGASMVYGPQKGASPQDVMVLEKGLESFNALVQKRTTENFGRIAGAGAAGGTAFGLKAFLNAEFVSGIDFMFKVIKLEELMKTENFDVILTGEGSMDEQTLNGKLIAGVLRLGKKYDVPVIAFCGSVTLDQRYLKDISGLEVVQTGKTEKNLAYNMQQAYPLLKDAVTTYLKNN